MSKWCLQAMNTAVNVKQTVFFNSYFAIHIYQTQSEFQ